MKKLILYSTICLFMLVPLYNWNSLLFSTIIEVKQDGTGGYDTIQEGINASADGDTVLVYPGTYYENVNLNGHHITLASLELTTGDFYYIDSTIIDGNQRGSCIRVDNGEQNVVIRGFSITNGSGDFYTVVT